MRILSIAFLLSVCAVPAGAFPLDSWTTPFPPNPCLPVTQQPILFSGSFCDGTTCPPDAYAPCTMPVANQFDQPGFPAGFERRAALTSFQEQAASARIESGRLVVHSSESWDQYVQINYVNDAKTDVDFEALGIEAFRCDVQGSMSDAQPLWIQVLVFDGLGGLAEGTARVSNAGTVTIPLADFILRNGFGFGKVRDYAFQIGDCLDEVCIGPQGPIDYSLGPLEFAATPTPARTTSWGQVKSLYR
jgi:hypothetical protein